MSPVREPLTQKRAFLFFYPLALSWLCMAAEAPICLSIINRSPNAVVNTAAFNLLFAIAIFIESPIIDLLSTSTALGRARKHYLAIRKFCIWLMIWVTVVHALVVWTPLYDFVTLSLLHQEKAVADAAHWPLRIMTLWSAFIGWRRMLQGFMIRNGATNTISLGTFLRVATVAGVGYGLHFYTPLDGLVAASIALLASVTAETVFVHIFAQGVVREHFHPDRPDQGESLSMGDLCRFHLPLTGATMVTFITGPVMAAALAQSEQPVENMAAWQLALSIVWLFRTITFALPEAVIALAQTADERRTMASFSLRVGLFLSAVMFLFFLTDADAWWLRQVLGADEDLVPLAKMAILMSVLLPLVGAEMIFLRVCLTGAKNTWGRLSAIGVGVAVLVISLTGGVFLHVPGIWNAAIGILAASVAELGVLVYAWSVTAKTLPDLTS
jgi:hypothetical protein